MPNRSRSRVERAFISRIGAERAEILLKFLGKARYKIIAKNFVEKFKERVELYEDRASKKYFKFIENKSIPLEARERVRTEEKRLDDVVYRGKRAGYDPIKRQNKKGLWVNTGYYYVGMSGFARKRVRGLKKAEAEVRKFNYRADVLSFSRRFGFSYNESRSFIKAIRADEKKEYQRLKAKIKRLPKGERRRAKYILGLGRLKSKSRQWAVTIMLKVLNSP